VLAGGAGQRLGGHKAVVELAGRPLISYPLDALRSVLEQVVVVARTDSELPELEVPLWLEPQGPRHPLWGLVHALGRAAPSPVLVCAVDLPLVRAGLVRALVTADAGGAPAVIARAAGRLQPLLGRYEQAALSALEDFEAGARVTTVVASLEPALLDVADAEQLLNVNTPDELAALEARLSRT
jgi:molybdopterin-guanine dinucleotide biosynthesis protein A